MSQWPPAHGPGQKGWGRNVPPPGRDRRGGGGGRDGSGRGGGWSYGPPPSGGSSGSQPHNPFEVKMPWFIDWVAETEDPEDASIIILDKRDDRLVSPFQAWLVSEIMANSASSINVLTERDQVMPPSSGFHLALFANYTLDGIKVVAAISIESSTGSACANWDGPTAEALSHPAFQPFSWPMLRDTSASYVDVKVYNGNEILFHWILRGFRSDTDLTVQQQFVDEFFVRELHKGKPRLSVVIAAFVGWRVSVFSYECGGRTYSVGPRGAVVAGDSARSRFEIRVCRRDSDDAVGNDADRIEFRYRDSNNRIDLKCSRTSVPGTWLTVSHISGPALVGTIMHVRTQGARVEGPEQTEQFGQLAAIHKGWWEKSIASSEKDVGSYVVFVGELEEGNFHVQTRSKLMVRENEVVARQALAMMQHDAGVRAPAGPPALTQDAWFTAATEARVGQPALTGEAEAIISQQAGVELNQRSFAFHRDQGTRGHVEDPERDLARSDRRMARSTAGLTPQLFAEEMARRTYNQTTATIEEIDPPPIPEDLRITSGGGLERSGPSTAAAAVPAADQPEVGMTTPRSKPTSLGPAGPQEK